MKTLNLLIIYYVLAVIFVASFLKASYLIYPRIPLIVFTPINASLWETWKMFFVSIFIVNAIIYWFIHSSFKLNVVISIIPSTMITCLAYYLIYLVTNHNPLVYFPAALISITCGAYVWFIIVKKPYLWKHLYNFSSLMLLLVFVIFSILTYHPLKHQYFKDPYTYYK